MQLLLQDSFCRLLAPGAASHAQQKAAKGLQPACRGRQCHRRMANLPVYWDGCQLRALPNIHCGEKPKGCSPHCSNIQTRGFQLWHTSTVSLHPHAASCSKLQQALSARLDGLRTPPTFRHGESQVLGPWPPSHACSGTDRKAAISLISPYIPHLCRQHVDDLVANSWARPCSCPCSAQHAQHP